MILEALGNGKFSLSAQGIDKPITIMADEVFEVRAIGKQLTLLRKPRDYDPSDHDTLLRCYRRPRSARDITVLAKYAAPSRVPSAVKIDIRTRRRGRLINTTQTIKGRRLIWQDLTRGYLQPAGVIVLPGGHAGFAAGFAGG